MNQTDQIHPADLQAGRSCGPFDGLTDYSPANCDFCDGGARDSLMIEFVGLNYVRQQFSHQRLLPKELAALVGEQSTSMEHMFFRDSIRPLGDQNSRRKRDNVSKHEHWTAGR